MGSYTIPTDWTTEDLIEALLPTEQACRILNETLDEELTHESKMWLRRVINIRQSQQAKPAQPELLHVAERKAY